MAASPASAAPLDPFASEWAEKYDVSGAWRLQRGDEVLAEGARGSFASGVGGAFTGDTPFWIGSNSKQFTAAAVLRLVEQGHLDLAAPLTRYFKELKPEVLTRGTSTCSVEHVLSHRCGLMRDAGGRGARHLSDAAGEADLLAAINESSLLFEPGTGFTYSNVGYALAGLLVQRASGQGLEQFLQAQFWGPLGMARTGIHPREGQPVAPGQAGAVVGWVDSERWLFIDPEELFGRVGAAGNIFSSARDLATWTRALHGGKVLSPSSWAELTRPRAEDYALGLVVKPSQIGRQIWHNGELMPLGISSWASYLPEHDLIAVVVANRPMTAGRSPALVDALLRKASGQPERPPTKTAQELRLANSQSVVIVGLLLFLIPALSLYLAFRRVRRPELLDRQSWWLSYHIHALWIASAIDFLASSALVVWVAAVLAGLYRSRFWQLPSWRQGPSRRPRLALALRSLWLLALLVGFVLDADSPQELTVPAAFVALLAAEALLWGVVARRTAAGPGAAAVHAPPAV